VFDDFFEGLRRFPESTIAQACKLYRERDDSKFFPTPGTLIAICRKIPDPGYTKLKQ